jgi:hypothetical protein
MLRTHGDIAITSVTARNDAIQCGDPAIDRNHHGWCAGGYLSRGQSEKLGGPSSLSAVTTVMPVAPASSRRP